MLQGEVHDFDLCMYGGLRPTRERWLLVNFSIPGLQQTCDGSHQHEHYLAVYAASRRVRRPPYPHGLCKTLAIAAVDWGRSSSWPHSTMLPVLEKQPRHLLPHFFDEFVGQVVMYKAECPPSTAQLFPEFDRYGRFTRCVTEGQTGHRAGNASLAYVSTRTSS
eukprot:4697892-Amphidinium_carterae.3